MKKLFDVDQLSVMIDITGGGTPYCGCTGSAPVSAQPPRDVSELYHELLYAVGRKFPGESRHETALRYIRDTEERACEAGSCKQNSPIGPQ